MPIPAQDTFSDIGHWDAVQSLLDSLSQNTSIQSSEDGAGVASILEAAGYLSPTAGGWQRTKAPYPICEMCRQAVRREYLTRLRRERKGEAKAAAEAAIAAEIARAEAAIAAEKARAKEEREQARRARSEAKLEAQQEAADRRLAKLDEVAATALEVGLPSIVAELVRQIPRTHPWAKIVEHLGRHKDPQLVEAAALLGLGWVDARGSRVNFDRAAVILGPPPDDPHLPRQFECHQCGRWEETLEAARAKRAAIDAVGISINDWMEFRDAPSPIVPAALQRDLHMTFEQAKAVLVAAERAGLLRAERRGYSVESARCASCYGYQAEEPVVWASSLRDAIPAQLRFRILQRDSFRCQYCGRSAREGATLHLDHVVPVAAGGKTTEENLIAACEQCNLGKSASSVIPD